MSEIREIAAQPWDMATCDYYLQVGTKSCTNPSGSCAFNGYPECHDLGNPHQCGEIWNGMSYDCVCGEPWQTFANVCSTQWRGAQ